MIRNEREIEMSKEITANEMMMQNMELTVDGKIVPISDNSEVESAIAFGLKDDFRDVFDALSDAYAGHEWQLMNNSSGEIYAHSDYDQGSAWYYGMNKKEDDMAWLRKAAGIGSGAKSNHGIYEGEEGYQITPRSLVAREMRKLQDIAKD